MSTAADIFETIKHRLPDRVEIYPALNTAIRLVSKRLYFHKSGLIVGELSVSVTAGSSSATLPSDFMGLMDRDFIYLDGYTYPLKPVPDQSIKLNYTSTSVPLYYEILGQTVYLYPGATSAQTINGPYWQKSTTITKPTDTIPFFELFDDVICEALIHTYQTGLSTGNPNDISLLKSLINDSVDEIAPHLGKVAPRRISDAMGLNYLTNSGD